MSTRWIWRSEVKKYAELEDKDVDTYMKENTTFNYAETTALRRFNDVCYVVTLKEDI